MALLDAAGVPCAPVQTAGEALRDLATTERAGLWWMEHDRYGRVATVASPLRLTGTPPALSRPAPALGEHTEEIARSGWGD